LGVPLWVRLSAVRGTLLQSFTHIRGDKCLSPDGSGILLRSLRSKRYSGQPETAPKKDRDCNNFYASCERLFRPELGATRTLVVDLSIEATDKKIAIGFIDGEFTVKRLRMKKDRLCPNRENFKYFPIKITQENQFMVSAS
jgi:hypothetical protein